MDAAPDNGSQWREKITPCLESLGMIVYNPLHKPIDIGREEISDKEICNKLKGEGRFEELSKEMHVVRCVDLKCVDKCDVVLVNLDTSMQICGTYEEIFWANRLKRPVIIMCPQGLTAIPNWLYGTLDYHLFFDNWDNVKQYFINISNGIINNKDWRIFDAIHK
jgi:hypothetical protein